jgi:hypothetical protein
MTRLTLLLLAFSFSVPAGAQTWNERERWPSHEYPPSTMEWRYPGEHPRWHERREERERHEERWRHEEWCRHHPRECR